NKRCRSVEARRKRKRCLIYKKKRVAAEGVHVDREGLKTPSDFSVVSGEQFSVTSFASETSFGSASSPPPTPPSSFFDSSETDDILDPCLLQYELEKETNFCPPDNENVTTQDLLTHMKKTNDELLSKAKKYKSACETKERIISDMRVEREN
uniref:Uncharacterized protein n=1 Tax=Amphimedon queenslandica TaxID=400682 RepID=A0A1X7U026_AMPQE